MNDCHTGVPEFTTTTDAVFEISHPQVPRFEIDWDSIGTTEEMFSVLKALFSSGAIQFRFVEETVDSMAEIKQHIYITDIEGLSAKEVAKLKVKELHEILNPFFIKVGRADIDIKYYGDDYRRLIEKFKRNQTDPQRFAQGAFYRQWSEQYYKPHYSPKTLLDYRFTSKYCRWERLQAHRVLSPMTMERLDIRQTHSVIQDSKIRKGYEVELVPPYVEFVKRNALSLTYLCMDERFWHEYNIMDEDLKDTYFRAKQLYYLRKKVQSNRKLYNYIRSL